MTQQNLIIRDLPGVADLEVDLLLRRNEYDGVEQDLAERVALKLFGVWSIEDNCELADDMLTAWVMADDETMEAMLTLGIDFSDTRGHPLRCTLLLAGPAEIAVRGIAGHPPDQSKAVLDRMTSNLERERDAFIARKRRGK